MTESSLTKVRELEGVLTESWPAAESELRDGWLLQATDGFTGRANSVAVISPGTRPAAEALTDAEQWYRRRELPPMVRLTPLSGPELEAELDTRGYVPQRTSAGVMVRSLDLVSEAPPPVALLPSATAAWLDVSGRDVRDIQAWEGMFRRLGDRAVFAAIEVDGQTAAVGQGALAHGYVSLFGMKTREDFRRRGLAAQVVAGLEAWGCARGARRATLQVETHNAGAQALYRRCGYEHVYDYRYLGTHTVLSRVKRPQDA